MQARTGLAMAVAAGLVLGSGSAARPAMSQEMAPSVTKAVAVLMPTAGSTVHGIVRFETVAGGVRITAQLEGLPGGNHGFHIHEFGDCSAADGTSAGGHYNPAGMAHAGPDAVQRHVGDLGNVTASAGGTGAYDRVDAVVTLDGPMSVLGRGVIVHAGADDLTSQPTGAAGARLACGVIGVAK